MKSHTQKITAVFVVPPEVHLLDFSGPAQVFYEAVEYGAAIDLKFISLDGNNDAAASCGVAFGKLTDYTSLTLGADDMIFVPGMEYHLLQNKGFLFSIQPFLRWMKEQHNRGVVLCSICTGAFLLAEAGLLDGKEATTHWKYLAEFQQRYRKIAVVHNRLFVDGETTYTSAGVASGIDLSLYILEKRYGSLFASSIAREVVVYFRRGNEDPQLSVFLKYRNHQEDRIHLIQEELTHHFDKRLTLDDLAERVSMSSRNLSRLFKDTTGITVSQYVEKLRIEHAVQLLREQHKVESIARACGFQSTNQLRHLFKKHTGTLPSGYPLS
jgi:transcriptional regulator GlxA family with amidase domain